MATLEQAKKYFTQDTANHVMTVIRDDGVHRHIRFGEPGTINASFELITWPGKLCYTGDMGTYVFERVTDMFTFFRREDGKCNPSYWAEKVISSDRDGVTEFSEERFTRNVMEQLIDWIRDHREETTKEERRELWEAVVNDVVHADGDEGGYRKTIAAMEFEHRVNEDCRFSFSDFWEVRNKEFTIRFLWCCYALPWAISMYDKSKEAVAA